MNQSMLPVTAMPLVDPGRARIEVMVPTGLTVAEIIAVALPALPANMLDRVRVSLVSAEGVAIIPREVWSRVRPNAGVHIVIRLIPGKDALKSVLAVLVTVAATAISGFFAPAVAGFLGISEGLAKGLLSLGLTALGGLLINALVPKPDDEDKEKSTFAIAGWRNSYAPDAPVPDVMGRIRYAPPFAAFSWTEVVGNDLYSRAVFLVGYGQVKISDLKLGDTLLSKYNEVQTEIREGLPGDAPLSLFSSQVIEVSQGVDLERLKPRNAAGEIIAGPAELTPVTRFTASHATGACVILSFPAGLIMIDQKGRDQFLFVSIQIRYRLVGASTWIYYDTVKIEAKKKVGFYRAIRWNFPVRGRYEIEATMMTEERDDDNTNIERCIWVTLQSFRPEYPLNFNKPLALVALRVKATSQLNGTLDNFNCIVSRVAKDWSGSAWVERETQNPASLARRVLQGPAATFPASDADLDLPAFQEWHEFCTAKGLKYNRVHDFDGSQGDTLKAIGAAGRAVVWQDGRKWTVVIDRPRDLVIDHVSPRNSSSFQWSAEYFRPPDALRVQFLDELNDFQEAERVIPWPTDLRYATRALLFADLSHADGTEAEVYADPTDVYNAVYVKSGASGSGFWELKSIELTEQIELPGKTHPNEIWIEARRRQHEIRNRSVRYSAVQQGSARTATKGDLVMASRDVLVRAMHSARVKAVRGNHVEIDEVFTMVAGRSYAIRFRQFDAADTVGASIVRTIMTVPGETSALLLTGSGEKPEPGTIIHFGPAALESIPLIVAGIERGKDNSSVLQMLPAAEIIDTRTDAEVPYPWNGLVGTIPGGSDAVPAAPVFTGILSGASGTGDVNGLIFFLAPGLSSAAMVGTYQIQHRLAGSGTWLGPLSCDAAEASISIPGYVSGNTVEFEARAISISGIIGAWTATVAVTIGENDAAIPSALSSATVTPDTGKATIDMVPGAGTATVTIYSQAGTGGILDREADIVASIAVVPGQPAQYIHGATTPLAAGDRTWWLEPFNDDAIPGPLFGPITDTIL